MTVEQSAPARPGCPAAERIQREHELEAVRAAAKTLEERLEMVGWDEERRAVHQIRDYAVDALGDLVERVQSEENAETLKHVFDDTPNISAEANR